MRKERDTTGFAEESEDGPKFKIWQLDQDWKEQQVDRAKAKSKAGAADNSNNLDKRLMETTIQNKKIENSMETLRGSGGP